MYRYLISFCLLLLPLLGMGQGTADTVARETVVLPDTADLPLRINGLRIGVDMKSWIQGIASGDRDLYNLHLRLDAGPGEVVRYGAMLDWTHSQANITGDSATYYHRGNALKVGFYLNAMPGDPDNNLLSIGIGYGRSWFDESLSGIVEDELYGSFPINRSSTGLSAGWLELSGGMQARVWKQLNVGYNLTLRLLPHFRDDEQVRIYEIPGFGNANNNSTFGFSYYLLYRFKL
ncbi:DUF6048 family protein [Cesiribacter sp. SM1]|uniref:DUF6048 family protein n=1 Tax=Cesiribacter sp. SM1 TaxID=2861196 RepID=UPI001CD57C37|nr:DUF6048 family protein [Cesiribacter sp. SM1]